MDSGLENWEAGWCEAVCINTSKTAMFSHNNKYVFSHPPTLISGKTNMSNIYFFPTFTAKYLETKNIAYHFARLDRY